MSIQQDFIAYHKSIGSELKNAQDRIRNLIGSSHWLTDGEHKENILRGIISDFSPEKYRIGTGFICYPGSEKEADKSSGQLDILITSKNQPTLYKSGDLHCITPKHASAIIEVKTKVKRGKKLTKIIKKLSSQIKRIRESSGNSGLCWAGLFIYDSGNLTDQDILKSLQEATSKDSNAVINCVSVGRSLFIRFWEHGHSSSSPEKEAMWHAYHLRNLSQAYFISNLIYHLSDEFDDVFSEAWFPEKSKEPFKTSYAKLSGDGVKEFK